MTTARHSFTPRLMQAPAAAHYIGVSVTKFHEKEIPQIRDGGNVLYDVLDLDAYVDSLKAPAESAPNGW